LSDQIVYVTVFVQNPTDLFQVVDFDVDMGRSTSRPPFFKDDHEIYFLHYQQLIATSDAQASEVRIVRQDNTGVRVRFETTAAQNSSGEPQVPGTHRHHRR
jgi:hypothetical protein